MHLIYIQYSPKRPCFFCEKLFPTISDIFRTKTIYAQKRCADGDTAPLRISDELMSYESILRPIAVKLLEENVNYPLTIVYLPLRWCGFAYKLFENILGKAQYYPLGSVPDPERRLLAQYHAPQTLAMKEMIIRQLTSKSSTVRIVFATVAIGMGVDIPNIRVVIHIGPPSSVQMYFQETG